LKTFEARVDEKQERIEQLLEKNEKTYCKQFAHPIARAKLTLS